VVCLRRSLQTSLNGIDTPKFWRYGPQVAIPEGELFFAMNYESQYKKFLSETEQALTELKLNNPAFLKPKEGIDVWQGAAKQAFLSVENLRQFVADSPDCTPGLRSLGRRLRTEFLKGLSAAETRFGMEAARESVAQLLPDLNQTQEGKILKSVADYLKFSLDELKDATDRLPGGLPHSGWHKVAEKTVNRTATFASLVKEELPDLVPAVKKHVKAVGEEIGVGISNVARYIGEEHAKWSYDTLLREAYAAVWATPNRRMATSLVGATVAAGSLVYLLSTSRVEAEEQPENAGRQSQPPATDVTWSRPQPALDAATQLWQQTDKSRLVANQGNQTPTGVTV